MPVSEIKEIKYNTTIMLKQQLLNWRNYLEEEIGDLDIL